METKQLQQLRKVVDVAVRRKVLIVSCILFGIAAGLAVYLVQPKVYTSTCLLTYEKQKINPNTMSPDEKGRISDVVSTLTQIVISRSSLEKIIKDLGLYKKEREKLPMEDVLAIMRRNISVAPSREGDTFRVEFSGGNPQEVVRITNALSALFIEENIKYREERATETSTYTKDELAMVKETLDTKETAMRDYKLKYYNEMADQRDTNTTRLVSLQEQYQERQNSIQDLERTRVLVRDQIALRKQVLDSTLAAAEQRLSAADRPTPVEPSRARLDRLQAELRMLQGRYTEQHPLIKSLKKKIAVLEQEVPAAPENGAVPETGGRRTSEPMDRTVFDLQAQLDNIAASVEKMNKEKVEIQALIKQHEQWIAAAPVREAEWSALTREHGELRRRYDFLVAQNLQAGSALNLERKQKGSQFKVVDAAQIPVKPIKPDFLKIMGIALLLGAGLGGGLALALETINTSFRDPALLEDATGLPIICSVPHIAFPREIARQRVWTAFGAVFFLVWAAAIVVAILYFWKQGRIVL